MCKKLIFLAVIALCLAIAAPSRAAVLSDNFDSPHDYMVDGTIGVIWDGYLNPILVAMSTIDPNAGHLYISSRSNGWQANDQGILLYVDAAGDFEATVEVTNCPGWWGTGWITYNNGGIMARLGDIAAGGAGED